MKSSKNTKSTNKPTSRNKKVTAAIITIAGLLLGFLTGMQFLIQGIENSLITESRQLLSDKTYLIVSGCKNSDGNEADTLCRTDVDTIENFLTTKVKNYDGAIDGYFTIIKNNHVYYYTAPAEVFGDIVKIKSSDQSEGGLLAVVGFERAAELVRDQLTHKSYEDDKIAFVNEVSRKTIGKTFNINGMNVFVAGIIPHGSSNFRITKQGQAFQPLNALLQLLDGNINDTNSMIFLENNSADFQHLLGQSTTDEKLAIIGFSDHRKAYNFYHQEKLRHNPEEFNRQSQNVNQELEIAEFLTSDLSSIYLYSKAKIALAIISGILIVATIISLSLVARKAIKDGSAKFHYLLNSGLKFLAVSLALAVIMAVVVSYLYKDLYSSALSLFFGHKTSNFKLLFGLNKEFFATILTAPAALAIALLLFKKK